MSEQEKITPQFPTWQEFQTGLVLRALKDECFRRELLDNPQAVVEKEIGKIKPGAHLKSHLKIKLIQQAPHELVITLPPSDLVLSDEELNKVVAAGIACSDIVMTGGGPGPNSTPFTFVIDTVKMA